MRSGLGNPNEQDVPESAGSRSERGAAESVANVWWSDRANAEAQLQRMRPLDLPRPESGSEGGTSVAAWRGAGLEDLHPPYEDLFAEAAMEMNRQTSVAGYPQADAERFLREQVSSAGVGVMNSGHLRNVPSAEVEALDRRDLARADERGSAVGLPTGSCSVGPAATAELHPGERIISAPANLQELSLEQIYEALDPKAENPLLAEMRRRIEASRRNSSRHSSEVTALEAVGERESVHSFRREMEAGVQSTQPRLTATGRHTPPNLMDYYHLNRALPPLPAVGNATRYNEGNPVRLGLEGDRLLQGNVRGCSGEKGERAVVPFPQAPCAHGHASGPSLPGSGFQPARSSAPPDSVGFSGCLGGSDPLGFGNMNPDLFRFSSPGGVSQPASQLGFRHSMGYPERLDTRLMESNPFGLASGSIGREDPFVTFRPKSMPLPDLLDLDLPAHTAAQPRVLDQPRAPLSARQLANPAYQHLTTSQVFPNAAPVDASHGVTGGSDCTNQHRQFGSEASRGQPAIVDLLDLEPPPAPPGVQPSDIWSGRATGTPFQVSRNEELGGREGYSTPRAGTSSGRSVYTPGGTRVPEYPGSGDGYVSPKHLGRCMHTPGGTRVPDSTPPPTPPKAVTFGNISVAPLPPSPSGYPDNYGGFVHHSPPPCAGDHPAPATLCDPANPVFPIAGSFTGQQKSEEPSRLVTALPVLDVGLVAAEASVHCGDWLARIGPLMRSLSPGAPGWWTKVTVRSSELYKRWLQADPLTRLSIKSEATSNVEDYGGLSRVEERGSVLLLQALPAELQSEAISDRGLSCISLIFLIMTKYQPGGSNEKTNILSFLSQPQVDGTANIQGCYHCLKRWQKLYKRCQELSLQVPDPLLLVRALDGLAKPLNQKPQSTFRLSSFRNTAKLDVAPNEFSVLQYCELLIAESEQVLLAQPDKLQRISALKADAGEQPPKTPQPGTPNPKASKANSNSNPNPKTPSPKHPSSQGPLNVDGVCRFFASESGCRYGRSCTHHHNELQPSDGRCFVCGATGHSMQQCDRPKSANPKVSPESGNPSPAKPKKPYPKSKPKPKAAALQAAGEGASSALADSGSGGNPLEIKIKAILAKVSDLPDASQRMGLMDGGATHCLRYAGPGEFSAATPVDVKLAVDTTSCLRINAVGVLLTDDPAVQPLMPMGIAAKELKCKVGWDELGCSVVHPEIGSLPITMEQECPMIPFSLCMDLISELEVRRGGAMLQSACVRACRVEPPNGDLLGIEGDQFLSRLRGIVDELFPDLPSHLKARVVPSAPHHAAASGLNRHCRRRLERGKAMIHVFSGKQEWVHPAGDPTLSVELEKGRDFMSDPLFFYLLDIARKGLVGKLLGGPPCKTFSLLRERGEGASADGGPGVLRSRYSVERFGRAGLTTQEQGQADHDTVLMIRFLLLAEVAVQGLACQEGLDQIERKLFFLLEHPEDPAEYMPRRAESEPTFASIWQWPEIATFTKRHGLAQASFHQGSLGHPKVKPTRVLLSSGFLWERLHQLKIASRMPWETPTAQTVGARLECVGPRPGIPDQAGS